MANMELVLDVYKRPYDARRPVVCMDESPKQLIAETRTPIPLALGRAERHDYEYRRCGVCNVLLAYEPLAGKRWVSILKSKTKQDWACFLKEIAEQWKGAEKITLVMDNLGTHTPGAIYETFPPDKAMALWDKFEFVFTPKHGSWLNMAEIELNVLTAQCLKRRIDDIEVVVKEARAWQEARNNKNAKVNWHFTTEDARIKLYRLYPSINS